MIERSMFCECRCTLRWNCNRTAFTAEFMCFTAFLIWENTLKTKSTDWKVPGLTWKGWKYSGYVIFWFFRWKDMKFRSYSAINVCFIADWMIDGGVWNSLDKRNEKRLRVRATKSILPQFQRHSANFVTGVLTEWNLGPSLWSGNKKNNSRWSGATKAHPDTKKFRRQNSITKVMFFF